MEHSAFDQKAIIKDQQDYLNAKIERITKLIELLEQTMGVNNQTDFKAFEHKEFVKMRD